MKTSYTAKDLKRYQLSLQAMRGLSWVTLAGVVWLGVTLVVRHVKLPALLIYLTHVLARLWTLLGWSTFALFALLLVVACCFRSLYPSWGKYFRSSHSTVGLLSWLREGVAVTSEKGEVTVQDSKTLDGFIAFVSGDAVLVVILVPKGIGGKGIVDNAIPPTKEYADGVLHDLRTGAVQSTAGARYWIYKR